ncbi:MAG: hypothetical protein ACE5DM_03930 [Candidatus Nanoarchaeia archaeon]
MVQAITEGEPSPRRVAPLIEVVPDLHSWYTHFYRNSSTRQLDAHFGMPERHIEPGETLYERLRTVNLVKRGYLPPFDMKDGEFRNKIALVLGHYASIATRLGFWAGMPEEEVMENSMMLSRRMRGVNGENIIRALERGYLHEQDLEGTTILYPAFKT